MSQNEKVSQILENVRKVIIGKEEVTSLVLTSILANGHILLEDVPGTGKTVMAKSFAKSFDAKFNRIQFTPDLLPSDVTGIHYYNQKMGEFVFREGPIFTNILLADEINRATPRTQSALLECMEERQVTIDGTTHVLDAPFLVIATQNPVETAGTYPLPEAQLDRFLMQINMGYPNKNEEVQMMHRFLLDSPLDTLQEVCTKEDILAMQTEAKKVYVHDAIMAYVAAIVEATREDAEVSIGVSPRGTLTMLQAARSYAYVNGRDYVVPEDIRTLAKPVFAHRLVLTRNMANRTQKEQLLERIVNSVEVPTEEWNK